MRCIDCEYYIISKMQGNHCGCLDIRPCDVEYKQNKRDKLNKKRKKRYEAE